MAIKSSTSVRYIVKRDLKDIFPKEFASRELISKFFDYIMNNFFQQSYEKYVNGYIGKKSVALEEGDFYVSENSDERQVYQLTPMVVSNTDTENSIVDYNNFINTLKIQGCMVNDQNRLISNSYWSWCPPINVDMFMNYNFYYWIEEGPVATNILTTTNAVTDIIGKKEFTCSYIDENENHISIPFKSGMRVIFKHDVNTEYNDKPFIVEGVGESIQLIDDSDILFSRVSEPDYYVMERGAVDGNAWSLRNRWFHRNVVTTMKNKTIYIVEDENGLIYYTDIQEKDMTDNTMLYLDIDLTQKYKVWFDLKYPVYRRETIEKTYQQAKKPIICFNKDIQLYNHGVYNRGYVDLYLKTPKNQIHGTANTSFQGITLEDGMYILLHTGDGSADDNKIFEVSGISSVGMVILQTAVNGISTDGKPVIGEGVRVRSGRYANQYYYFNGSEWVMGQQKDTINQSPLFELYDSEKNSLNNSLVYPSSSFKGSKIFDYKTTEDISTILDEDLNRRIITSGYGNYIFNNLISTETYTYVDYDSLKTINGFKFFKLNGEDTYLNNWYYSKDKTSQYIITEILVTDEKNTEEYINSDGFKEINIVYRLEIEPDNSENKKNSFVYLNGNLLENGVDYTIDGNKLKIFPNVSLKSDDTLYIRLLKSKIIGDLPNGYYFDLPLSLTANAKNEDITEIKYNECFDQMKSIIENQTNFSGESTAANNYNDTRKDLSLGTEILQHSNPILKSMLLNSKEFTNIRTVLTYITNEYSKFKNKFRTVIENMSNIGEYNENEVITIYNNAGQMQSIIRETDATDIIKKALAKINIGKEGLNPFYNNGMASQLGECYIPSTPAYLGLDICYEPKIIVMDNNPSKPSVLLCHDGSYTRLFNDYRDNALIAMERAIYDSIPNKFKQGLPNYNKFKYIPGKFRETDYNQEEYKQFIAPMLESWSQENNIDYTINDMYDRNDPFSWNWSSCKDVEGEQLYGSYRAIYQYYYDTVRPHTHPWEMLGFGEKPIWWENYYGKAPYTSVNIPMWMDIEKGYIADGNSKGYHKEFERPNLVSKYLPVDENGNLLNPYQIGITTEQPLPYDARKSWNVGDLGKYEYAWTFTSEYKYALQTILYLMKPIEWLETNWDTLNNIILFENSDYEQIINNEFDKRLTPSEIMVHNELVDEKYLQKIGVQQWISDFLTNENINISSYCGNPIRNIDMQLGYKCGCFYKQDSLKIISDNYGVIPSQNYHMDLYKTLTTNQFTYSAMVVQKVESGYMIDGYDVEQPFFKVKLPEYNGRKTPIEINNKNYIYYNQWTDNIKKINYKTVFKSIQDLYNVIVGYGRYLEDVEKWTFTMLDNYGEIVDFRNKGKDFLIWANLALENNAIIMLNPGCYKMTINHNAFIDKIGQYNNGYWTVSDTAYNPIYNNKLKVYRHQGYTEIEPTDKIMTLLKVREIENEHILLFDNTTVYGDTIYDPLLCVKAQRLKIMGIAVDGWDGTFFAPGYLIQSNGAVPNYDKLVEDFKYFYDTDDIRSFGIFGDYAKKTIGYRDETYMERLLVDDRNMFDFYKGLLKEKGTKLSFGKLNRSKKIMSNADSKIDLYENWAFKLGDFGYTYNNSVMEFNIMPDKIVQDPQIVTFTTGNDIVKDNDVVQITWNDECWLKKKDTKTENKFNFIDLKTTYPTGGFARVEDVQYVVADLEELDSLSDTIKNGDKIWIIKSDGRDWNVVKKVNDDYKSLKVNNFNDLMSFDTSILDKDDLVYVCRANMSANILNIKDPNELIKMPESISDKNAWSVFKYVGHNGYDCVVSAPNGVVSKSDESTLSIMKNIVVKFPNGYDTNGEKLYTTYTNTEFKDVNTTETTQYIGLDINGDGVAISNLYVQDNQPSSALINDVWYSEKENKTKIYKSNGWNSIQIVILSNVIMYKDTQYNDTSIVSYTQILPFELERLETKIVNAKCIESCYMVDNETDETLSRVQVYDPLQGVFPNNVLKEITYITALDPVNYEETNSWDDSKLGYLWWDLSKVRYINYYQGDILYKRNNWGKQLPGSEIAIMEWTKSSELPENVTKYVVKEEYNYTTLTNETWYYYWNKNSVDVPTNDFRTISAFAISQTMNSPQDMGIIWVAPINVNILNNVESSFIIGNFDTISAGKDFVVQFNFTVDDESEEHEEWVLVKENTDANIPTQLWQKMKDSLLGYDELGQVVPNPSLNEQTKLGISVRPRQTMFKNLAEARHNFVDIINNIFASRDILVELDVDKLEWKNIFLDVDKPTLTPDYIVETHSVLNTLADEDLIGKYILVNHDEMYNEIWTLWYVNNLKDYSLVEYQHYDVTKYWKYVDFYKDRLTELAIPQYIVDSESKLPSLMETENLKNGDIIKTYTGSENKWMLKEYIDGTFYTIGLEDGSLYVLETLYDFMMDESVINDLNEYIDGMTKYQYLMREVGIVIEKIISYFEID